MRTLEGKIAVVTGGARGLGVAYVRALAAAGAHVAVADIEDGEPLARELSTAHPGVTVIASRTDVSDESAVRSFVDAVVARHGRIDILVNNAAIFSSLDAVDTDQLAVELWDRVMAVNIRGPFLMCKHVSPVMKRQKGGKIINISSGVAYKGMRRMLHYATSKGAMLAFTRSLARELGDWNINVNTVAPGLILSDSIAANSKHIKDFRAPVIASRALKRDGYPRDLVGTLLFLASDASDFITGQTIAVDGGSVNT